MIKPKLSIVIPTYNRLLKLKACLSSVQEQSYTNYEIIIINDGSTDGTKEFLNTLKNLPEYLIINNDSNIGLQRSLNKAVARGSGEYIARIDDDDLWIDSDKTAKQIEFLEQNPDYGLVGSNYLIGDRDYFNPESDEEIRNQILLRCPFRHSTIIFRKALWERVGAYNEELEYSEDWDLWLKIGRISKLKNLKDVTARIDEGENLTNKYFLKQIPINAQLVEEYKNDYPGKIKAVLYHKLVSFFFRVIPLDSVVHKFFKKIFLKVFSMVRK